VKSLELSIVLGASLAFACGSGAAPGDDAAHEVPAAAGHAGNSTSTAGSAAGGAAAGGKASNAAAAGQSGSGGQVTGSAGDEARGGNSARGGAGGSAAGVGSAGAPNSGGAAGTGAAGASGSADGGRAGTTGGRAGAGAPAGGAPGGGGPTGGASNGGAPNAGSSGRGGSGAAGAGGDAAGPFTCNQVTGGQLVEEWFIAGFEKVVDDPRWQVKWRVDGYLEEWANPQSSFWSAQVDSTCTKNTGSPDRIVFPVVSFTSRSRTDWAKLIEQAITTFKGKYAGIRRMDLMTQVRGPGNMLCPTAPTQGETIVVPPELDGAIDDVAAAHPGFVFVGPHVEARSCSDIQGGGPHLTSAGNTAAAVPISNYFVSAQ